MNKISVIIPCYNVEKYIEECIDSVFRQTHQDLEIICINDGSTDNTLAILKKYQLNRPDKINVLSFVNQGAPASRNAGFKISTGDYIQFLDADDVITPDKFESQLQGFQDKDTDVVISDREVKNVDLSVTIQTLYFRDVQLNPLETAITSVITTGNPLYRRNVVNCLEGHDETLTSAQDWDFHIRMVLAGFKIKYVPGIFFINRVVSGSISSNWKKVSIQASLVIIKLKKQLLENQLMNEKIKNYIAHLFMDSAIYAGNKEEAKEYVNELIFWSKGDYTFVNGFMKQMAISFIGIKRMIAIQRMIQKSGNKK